MMNKFKLGDEVYGVSAYSNAIALWKGVVTSLTMERGKKTIYGLDCSNAPHLEEELHTLDEAKTLLTESVKARHAAENAKLKKELNKYK